MSLKIPVEDRVSTYPGRVVLTPVTGETNTYDMARADVPITEGTPINKKLFDNKAYTLTEDAILYVDYSGNDVTGNGSTEAPYATVQKAIDSIPKHLGGHTAEISIGFGVYPERVTVEGFTAGRLVIGRPGELGIINGIDIINSSFVETNIYQIDRATGSSRPLFLVKDGSNVLIASDMILDGVDMGINGIMVENNSHVVTGTNVTLTVNNCGSTILSQWCSFVSVNKITGSGNMFGMSASQGAIISYKTDTTSKNWSNYASYGGLVLTESNSSDLSGATLDL